MKLSVIAPIGTTPPVITEFIQYVEDGLGERVSDLTVIYTSDPFVVSCTDLAEQAVLDRYPHIHFHRYQLGFEDIDSQERLSEFMLNAAMLLRDQVEKFKADKVYVNSAGGRKDALIALSTLCQFLPVSGIFHIVMPDVKSFNIELERAKHDIEMFGTTEDKKTYYLSKKSLFEPLMYPHPSTYSVIKIPVIPFPPSVLQKLVKILSSSKTEIRSSGLDPKHAKMLASIGIVTSDRSHLYPTDEGRFLLKIIKTIHK
ncbi:MAG: CRISPR-associated protein Csx14 [Thermofilum sp.]|uniref:CRISPR-associated protein Csx14 n=1 Tax=Thermofilum sp. TaxID=1961369 RepID=UPI00315E4BDF